MVRKWDLGMVGAVLLGVAFGLAISGSLDLMNRTSADDKADRAKLEKELDGLTKGAQAFTQTFPTLVKLVRPSVVTIHTEKKLKKVKSQTFKVPPELRKELPWWLHQMPDDRFEFRMPERIQPRGTGSGVIVDDKGHIVTNSHVVRGMDEGEIKVKLHDEREFDAKIVAVDPKTDVAVIKIEAEGLVPARFGDSQALEVGEWVISMGAPFGLEQSVGAGIISAKGRRDVSIIRNDFRQEDFLQTDAAVNPGNSGGPLVNLRGEVVGICTAIATRSGGDDGVGFAIPSHIVKYVMRQLIDKKKVTRGYLGVEMFPIDDDPSAQMQGFENAKDLREKLKINQTEGVYVRTVRSGSPADKAGIVPEDVIVEFDGRKITDGHSLSDAVRVTEVGKTAKVGIIRGGKRIDLNVLIVEQPEGTTEVAEGAEEGAGQELSDLGARVSEVTPELAKKYDLDKEKGVVVTEVGQGSPAALASLREGDLIQKVNGTPVAAVSEFQEAIKPFAKGELVTLIIRNKDGLRAVRIRQDKEQ